MSISDPQTLLDTPVVGLPDLQRTVFYILFEGLNTALTQIAAYWLARDQRFDEITGRETSPTTLEMFANDNFHEGHKPSLINSIPDNYPNVAVFATMADPDSESARLDHMDIWSDTVLIETMVKGKSGEEDTVNRRIQRTVEAIILCIRRNPDMAGAIIGSVGQPVVRISDLMAVRSPAQSGGYGDRFLWQGAQIIFRIRKDSVMPSDGSNTFAESSSTDYSPFIDQG